MTENELEEARNLLKKIREVEWEIVALRANATKLVPILDGMPRTKNERSKVEELTVKIISREEEVTQLKNKFAETSWRIHMSIFCSHLDALEKSVLSLRYSSCQTFKEIQDELKITEATTFYVHRTARKKILKPIKVD